MQIAMRRRSPVQGQLFSFLLLTLLAARPAAANISDVALSTELGAGLSTLTQNVDPSLSLAAGLVTDWGLAQELELGIRRYDTNYFADKVPFKVYGRRLAVPIRLGVRYIGRLGRVEPIFTLRLGGAVTQTTATKLITVATSLTGKGLTGSTYDFNLAYHVGLGLNFPATRHVSLGFNVAYDGIDSGGGGSLISDAQILFNFNLRIMLGLSS